MGDATLDIFLDIPEATTECQIDTHQCVLCFSYADKVAVSSLKRVVGGNAANNAVGSARLGLKVGIYGVTGDDLWSHHIHRALKDERVDTSQLILTPKQEANTSVILSNHGERTVLVYHLPRKYVWPKNMPPSRYLYFTSMRTGFEKNHSKIIDYVKSTGAKLVFQPGTFQLMLGLKKLKPLLKYTELLVLNREEAAQLLNKPSITSVGELLHDLRKVGPRLISITDGEAGAWGCDGQNCYQLPIYPGKRIESTGAGDAFATAVVAALALGKSFKEALTWGPVNSASVIQQVGPQAGLLTRKQLEADLKKVKSYKATVFKH